MRQQIFPILLGELCLSVTSLRYEAWIRVPLLRMIASHTNAYPDDPDEYDCIAYGLT